jgi:hypothetical protein
MQGEVLVDGYSVEVSQPNARRVSADHEGDVPEDCLPHGTDTCKAGHPSLLLNEKDFVGREQSSSLGLCKQHSQVRPFTLANFICSAIKYL